MPQTHFICSDGNTHPISECTKRNGCRLGDRCIKSLNTLTLLGDQRKWGGVPSCTQLLNGTREEYLKIKHDYEENPIMGMYALLGTKVHSNVEKRSSISVSEYQLKYMGIKGTCDELYREGDMWTLVDHKTSGNFKVNKVLKGEDNEWALQLNWYRIAAENNMKIKVEELWMNAIVRDGGLTIPKYFVNNIHPDLLTMDKTTARYKTYVSIPINIIEDQYVIDFFEKKKNDLLSALEFDRLPDLCSDQESWDGNKCKKYCSVASICRPKIKGETNEI